MGCCFVKSLRLCSRSRRTRGALGRTSVSWPCCTPSQNLLNQPHIHCVVPAGGLAPDGARWVPCRPHFFLPVRVLSRRFRRLYLEGLEHLYGQGQLPLTGRCRELVEPKPWQRFLTALRDKEWVVYAKEPIQDPRHILQ